MEIYRYLDEELSRLNECVTLLKTKDYAKCIDILHQLYDGLQSKFPQTIPKVYLKDSIGYSHWNDSALMEIGEHCQKLVMYLHKKNFIEANNVIAYIEGAEKAIEIYGIHAENNLRAAMVLEGIYHVYYA